MAAERYVKLFRNGRNRAVRIPREFEFPGDEVIMRKEGDCIVLTPVKGRSLLELLRSWEPLDDDRLVIEELPIDDVEL